MTTATPPTRPVAVRYSRTGRPRPAGGDRLELAIWYLMRLTGLGLFVLALSHFLITHVLFDPANQTAEWIATHRWANDLWRATDGTMLVLVVFHSFVGVRTVLQDYVGGRLRTILLVILAVLGVALAAIGLIAVLNAQAPMP
jgi:succinate dehydrogenase / fumarate reductase membrane anchor subunit